jgi:hypothetical protein
MSKGVFTRMKRVEFVEKTSSEVGDGTAFPMEVTLDQLAEIMYRVRKSVVYGAITETYDNGIDPPSDITLGVAGTPAANQVEFTSVDDGFGYTVYWFVQRGYSTNDPIGWESYFGEPYAVNSIFTAQIPEYEDCSDADDERAMWIPDSSSVGFNNSNDFKTGFSHYLAGTWNGGGDFTYSGYKAYINLGGAVDYTAIANLTFGKQIAWIDENGSGNPYDPLNKIYISLEFNIQGEFYTGEFWSTRLEISVNEYPMNVPFEIELTTGDVISCPMYGNRSISDPDYTYSGSIRATATEWWPYAKDNPAVAVWDTDNGAKL